MKLKVEFRCKNQFEKNERKDIKTLNVIPFLKTGFRKKRLKRKRRDKKEDKRTKENEKVQMK